MRTRGKMVQAVECLAVGRWCGLAMLGWLIAALGLLMFPTQAAAQGFLLVENATEEVRMPRPPYPVPPIPGPPPVTRPPQTYQIRQLAVQGTLVDQVARLQVTQTFVNTASVPIEASFVFPLPYEGAVDRLTFLVDGKEYDAKLLDAQEARRIYESYVRRNRDPALLEWIGTGLFKTSVFPIPPGAERTVTLRYSQVLRQSGGVTELWFPWSAAKYTSQPIEKLSVELGLESRVPLRSIYSPSHAVNVRRADERHAEVTLTQSNEVPLADFRLLYDVGKQAVGASVLSYRPSTTEDGYLLMLVTPEIPTEAAQAPRKNVVFVVDRSGSMSGPKIEQAKSALRFVLNNLREGDLFNIIAYDTEVEQFRPEMQRFNDENRDAALGYVAGIHPGGSTNIDGALRAAFEQLRDSSRPNYVLFLTDGLPTAGVTREVEIADNARQRNQVRARLFAFGVGYDVNSRLLDKLARGGYGLSEYVRPNEDIEAHVSRLYNRIGAPALSDVRLEVRVAGASVAEGPAINRVYPKQIHDLFAGDQLVLVGRYGKAGAATLRISGQVDGVERGFEFAAELTDKSPVDAPAYIEKLWAVRRVGEIIDQIDLQGRNQELVDELIALSKKHGILTPYTSFLADDQPAVRELAAARAATESRLDRLNVASGQSGFVQRSNKGMLQNQAIAPAAGGASFADADEDRVVVVRTVQNVGRKTFYWRSDRWVDEAAEAQPQQPTRKVKRFSDEYFELVTRHGRAATPYLALEGHIVVQLGDELVEIE